MQHVTKALKLSLVAALFASLVAPGQAAAANMKWGPLELHPYAKVTETYDSNIYLQPKSKVKGQNANGNLAGPVIGSWITDLNGGLNTNLALSERHNLSAGYDAVWRAYKKDPRVNNTVNQSASAAYGYKGPSGLSASLKDNYLSTADPATSELTARAKRWNNTGSGNVEYGPEGGNLYVSADGSHSVDKYVANDSVLRSLLNRYTQTFGGKLGWKLGATTKLYTGYHRQLIHYTDHPASPTKNSKAHLADLGVDGTIAPKLTGQVQAGLQYREYDDLATGAVSKISRNWMVATMLKWKPVERTTVDLSLTRRLEEATFSNNQFYIASSAQMNVAHNLPCKLAIGVNLGVENDKYLIASNPTSSANFSANRRDDLYQQGVSLDYPIQEWLKVGASYLHRQRFSKNFTEQFNYEDHQTALKLAVLF